ncbi:mast cell protease 4 isoform X2 [Astyanax mexicanus]|uniref:Mast cell protease 4-like n=2 Tax=Astyanax mexicanus TaxID=7994 RepID=A0A8B9RBX0_ASTMX|nr:mast cell protease 4 isoform X2 [Astyanax mexicanus]
MTLISLLLLVVLLPYPGHSASVRDGIVNGTEAKPHSRPYMVSVQIDEKHQCGGFLVSESFVMTAAHCWKKKVTFTAVVGAHDISNKNEGSIRFPVEKYAVHPQYQDDETYDYDILLLKLKGTVIKSERVKWISIPAQKEDIPANSVCSVAGWGRTGTKKSGSHCLLETNTKIMDKARCTSLWDTPITPRMVCAQHPGGPCWGDSGGPLVCDSVAVGIVSFGDANTCDKPIQPEVYTKISEILPWIKSIINS